MPSLAKSVPRWKLPTSRDLLARQLHLRRLSGRHQPRIDLINRLLAGDVNQGGPRGLQCLPVPVERPLQLVGKHPVADVEADHANRAAEEVRLPQHRHVVLEVDRMNFLDAAATTRERDSSQRKATAAGQRVPRTADQHDVGAEVPDQLHRAVEQGILETTFHEHQHHGERDTRHGDQQPPHVVRQVLPGQWRVSEVRT